jgi:heme-degrading monooxygenase HmoA
VNSQAFQHGHARAESSDGQPVATGSALLGFEVVQQVTKPAD